MTNNTEIEATIEEYGNTGGFKFVRTGKGTFWVEDPNVQAGDKVVVSAEAGCYYAFVVKIVSRG